MRWHRLDLAKLGQTRRSERPLGPSWVIFARVKASSKCCRSYTARQGTQDDKRFDLMWPAHVASVAACGLQAVSGVSASHPKESNVAPGAAVVTTGGSIAARIGR